MRMFGEATAKHLGLLLNIPLCENQHDLCANSVKSPSLMTTFSVHKLRRIGNQAVHEYHNDPDDAQMCLRLRLRAGCLVYYRLVTKDYDFPVPVFVLPERGENPYHQEVLTLKQQLEQQACEKKAQSQAEVEAQQQKLVALNGCIAIQRAGRKPKRNPGSPCCTGSTARREERAELAKQTEQERKAYHKEITDQAIKRTLNLSEEEGVGFPMTRNCRCCVCRPIAKSRALQRRAPGKPENMKSLPNGLTG